VTISDRNRSWLSTSLFPQYLVSSGETPASTLAVIAPLGGRGHYP